MTAAATDGPHDVLVVGWYPRADDPIAGRFIADQAAALAATGRVRPWVTSFDPFWLHGDRGMRARAADAWPTAVRDAARDAMVPTPSGAFGPAGIPVARLGTPGGTAPGAGHDNEVIHRTRSLIAALDEMRRPVDLVHGHVGYPEGAAAARVAAHVGVPFILTEHASYLDRILADPVFRARYRTAGLTARRIIAVGTMLRDQIAANLPELADRLVVIPNAVDIASFPAAGPADRDGHELLWVGYRQESKGTGALLRAFARVHELRPATRLRLVGRSPSEEEEAGWHALAAGLGIGAVVRFDPPAERAGVADAMKQAGIFVHASDRETFGVVAVEALATGLPVVATDSGGVTDVLGSEPDILGALVPRGDPDALVAAILRVLDRRSSFDPARLRASVEERFGAPAVAGRIADLYDEIRATAPTARRTRARPAGRGAAPPPADPAALRSMTAHPVLVAFDRPALDRLLPTCPAWLLEGVIVVTRGGPVSGVHATVSIPGDIEASLVTLLGWRSAGRPFPAPIRWLRRLRKRARLEAQVMPSLAIAVKDGIAAAVVRRRGAEGGVPADGIASGPRPTGPVLVLCLGGIDVVAARPAVAAGHARFGPGGLRWLGDARWPGQVEASSS
jgi:glycosyltransferase involved in cell wall biosynthesis